VGVGGRVEWPGAEMTVLLLVVVVSVHTLTPLCKAAVVAALGVGGGEVPKAVPLHNLLLTLACQRVGARTTETSLRGTSYKAPVERGEELARLLVWAP